MRSKEYAYVVTFVGLVGSLFCVIYLILNG